MSDRLFRILCHLAGVDHRRMQDSPLGDRQFAVRIGLQLLFSSTFLFSIFASSLLIGFGDDLVSDIVVIAMAFVTACVVLLVDVQIVQSDFYQHGLLLARDRGFNDGVNGRWAKLRAKLKRPLQISLRLCLSMIIAYAFSLFFELRLFGSDIKRQIDDDYRHANAALFQDVAHRYDANVRLMDEDIGRQDVALGVLGRQEAEVRDRLFGANDSDREIPVAAEKLSKLIAAKVVVDAEALRREGDAINEKNGIKETKDQSGRKGQGDRYTAATERATLARRESSRLAQEIASVQSELADAGSRREQERQKNGIFMSSGLQKISDDVAKAHVARDDLSSKRDKALANREAAILAIAAERPGYVPKIDGFLSRVEALEALKERPAVARTSFWTKLVIMAIEISAVISKVFFSVPTIYSVRAALDFEDAARESSERARRSPANGEVDAVREDIELEELRSELAAKRAARRSLYSDPRKEDRDAA